MSRIRQIKTNFTAGEVSRRLLGRGDLRAYENGALSLRNVFIHPTGGVTRRAGLYFCEIAAGPGRLVAFEFNTEQTYLLAFSAGWMTVLKDGEQVAQLAAPWTAAQLKAITWTQSADTLLVCHPDLPPKRITRSSDTSWAIGDWQFASDGEVTHRPFYKFADAEVTVTPSALTGAITLTASTGIFQAGHAGTRMRVRGKQVSVTAVLSPTVAEAAVLETLPASGATKDWEEQAFSAVRGWPASAAFHQDRLVIGGSRDLPNRLWLSRSGELWNFDLGTGLDDEAIEFAILSDQVNAIRAVFSGRHLQVFTSGAEWMVTGTPLTPQTVQLNRQTRIGMATDRFVPPVDVDGATLFVARNGREVREFLYTDVEQAYQATDLALLARHLFAGPVDQAFDGRRRVLFLVMENGKAAGLTVYRAESVAAWTLHATDGAIRSMAVVGDDIFALVERSRSAGPVWTIERFDEEVNLDAALVGDAGTPTATWTGLSHLEGRSVAVVADGVVRPYATVTGGAIAIDPPARHVEAGLPYTHLVEPLPPSALGQGGDGRALRLVEAVFRVEDTAALRVDVGRGLRDVALRRLIPGGVLDEPPPAVSGDVRVRAFGWRGDAARPPWRVENSAPLPFTLLSVVTEMRVND